MPRTRSEKYDEKRDHILDVAASIFANQGYIGCKMEDIAEKCNVSKSMLYHYFKKKEEVLFEILRRHVSLLNATIENYLDTADCKNNHEYFVRFIEKYLERSSKARERHAVTLNDTRYLTHEQMMAQEALERRNVELIVQILKKVNPGLNGREYKVYALLLIGMINWVELWYRSSGSITRAELFERISVLFLDGFLAGFGKRKKKQTRCPP